MLIGNRLMAGHCALNAVMWVRPLLPEPRTEVTGSHGGLQPRAAYSARLSRCSNHRSDIPYEKAGSVYSLDNILIPGVKALTSTNGTVV